MSTDWAAAMFGQISSNGVALELVGGLDFKTPLRATVNTQTRMIEITTTDAHLTPPDSDTDYYKVLFANGDDLGYSPGIFVDGATQSLLRFGDSVISDLGKLNFAHNTVVLAGDPNGGGDAVPLFTWGAATNSIAVGGESTGTLYLAAGDGVVIEVGGNAALTGYNDGGVGSGYVVLDEAASAPVNPASGTYWVKNTTPSMPFFVDDTSVAYCLGPIEEPQTISAEDTNLSLTHFRKFNRFSSSSGTPSLTVQPDATVDFPVGSVVNCQYSGTTSFTLVAGGGVTLTVCPSDLTLVVKPKGWFTLRKVAANEWIVTGGLVPV